MENKKIAVVALLLALVGIAGAGIQYLENVTCQNCTLVSPTITNFSFPTSGNRFDEILVNDISKNDTLISNRIGINNDLQTKNDPFYFYSLNLKNYYLIRNDMVRMLYDDSTIRSRITVRGTSSQIDSFNYANSDNFLFEQDAVNAYQRYFAGNGTHYNEIYQYPAKVDMKQDGIISLTINDNLTMNSNLNNIRIYSNVSNICYSIKIDDNGTFFSEKC